MKVVHSWLKEYLGDNLPSAEQVEELLNFHAFEVEGREQVEGEEVIDIDVLPNRSSDCLCHRGIARELATILGVDMEVDPLLEPVELAETDKIAVRIADHEACPRFTASLITDIEVKDSPEWLQTRLRALGQRPINNIVDATNYIMLAIGQPIHAYDADLFTQVDGQWQFGVRFAEEGETVSLLAEGGKEEERIVELKGHELLIIDDSSNTPIGLAGVKGGKYAGVHKDTKNIIIEAAHFHPTITRKTARGLGIVIDASKRFENEPSRELPLCAQRDIIKLITEIAGGTSEGVVDKYLVKQEVKEVVVTVAKTNSLLGLSLEADEIVNIIKRTGSSVEEVDEGGFKVVPPWERTDLNIEEDYIEEVGRIHGLSDIKSVVPEAVPLKEMSARHFYSDKIRKTLIDEGFSEVITSSFQKKGKLQLRNALASDKSYLRNSLIKNITGVLDANYVHTDLLGINDVRVFEIGTVFEKSDESINEKTVLTLGARTKGDGYNSKDDKVLQEGCEVVSNALGIKIDWNIEKGVAEMNLSDLLENLPAPTAYDQFEKGADVTFKPISQYPAMSRDIALWVGEGETPDAVLAVLLGEASTLCVRHTLFDTFSKDGRTSYAFRLVFQSTEKTLTDVEVNAIMDTIYQKAGAHNWEVR
ncbi:phenylalanine--tRNA ligase subunit beta [Candidatus Kaiserbacteria bacterium]|nr:phenylalanine--tRNA ligase subunit beta [Candidatus Kaiserbacteria bacterium]